MTAKFARSVHSRPQVMEEDENPFQKGSLLANIRESTDQYVLEALSDPVNTDVPHCEVAKRLEFPMQPVPVSKDPILMAKQRVGVAQEAPRRLFQPEKNLVEDFERRHLERLASHKLLIEKEKAAISKERVPARAPVAPLPPPDRPRPDIAFPGAPTNLIKMSDLFKPDTKPILTPKKALLLMRLDERVSAV